MKGFATLCACTAGFLMWSIASPACAISDAAITSGRLDASDAKGRPLGPCPLKHTDVKVEIAGFVARVTVVQKFHNPFTDSIEALYVFPLSQDAAVDRMVMQIGDRTIKGQIKERGEAKRIYEAAKQAGHLTSLLDQERPNIFRQSVANIHPGDEVDVTISYTETLDWRDGTYHFDFPTVVGPRYIPGGAIAAPADSAGTAPPTDQVPDADRVTPPVTAEGTRAGHDLSISVQINAGLPIRAIESAQHKIDVDYPEKDKTQARVRLKSLRTIPNKDFALTYQTASDVIEDSLLTHTDDRGNFFALVLQPPARVAAEEIAPKELVFVIDKSGSMNGFPIETAKETMRLCIEQLQPKDTFNLMTFEGGVGFCFEKPVDNTAANRERALTYLASLAGSGVTEMMPAIHACLAGQDDPKRLRVVCFMTDGYVGNDMAIIQAVKEHAGVARVFSFGIGRSVNRFLLDGIARAGRGDVEYVLDPKQAPSAAKRFSERVRSPVLTDIELDFGGLDIEQVHPRSVPDLFSAQPVVVVGCYTKAGEGQIKLRGKTGKGDFTREIKVTLPEREPGNDVLASLWARARVAELMDGDLVGIQRGTPTPGVKEEIVGLGLRYSLLTQFTSFVAVEEDRTVTGAPVKTVPVQVEMPQDVSYEHVFGSAGGHGLGMGSRVGSGAGVVGTFGGTKSSERTVAAGLGWLARQQERDGSWRFANESRSPDDEKNYGDEASSQVGATALALLPFLGAGQNHKSKGPYQKAIARGVTWLVQKQKESGAFEDGVEKIAPGHALATIALCETYAQTKDKTVGEAAQLALRFIESKQSSKTGGWGSTLASSWAILALSTGKAAGLEVSPQALTSASGFLDRMQSEDGAYYGQAGPGKDPSATAAGLGCRVLLGRKKDAPALVKGLDYLAALGPSNNDAEHDFFATLVLHSASGPRWNAWTRALRRQLIESQTKKGEHDGSWSLETAAGEGDVRQTALNLLSLEIYYRYLVLFKS